MAGTPPSTKRMKSRGVKSSGKLEGWFAGDTNLISKYLLETSRKNVNTPKVVSFSWMKQQKLDSVRSVLKEQKLKRFLKITWNIYPDLVKVFYTNLTYDGDSLISHVKCVDMVITNEVWSAVTGLKSSGLRINRGNLGIVEDFNKIQFYKSCLKNPHYKVRNFSVGGLKLDERLVAFIVSWILTPRGSNHSTLSEEDLPMIYCIMNKVKINWIHTIKEHMRKAMRFCDFHYPYAILISKFLHYFEVDIEGELAEVIKPSNEINSGSLSKMRFTKIGGRWVSKYGGTIEGNEAEEAAMQDDPAAGPQKGMYHDINMEERMPSMSSFEMQMLNRMDTFADNQRNLYDICESRFTNMDTRFSTLDEQIEEVQRQILELQFQREDSPSF